MTRILPRLWAATVLSLAITPKAQAQASYTVVVNAENPVSTITKAQLSNAFLKKVVRWNDGSSIAPVDQERTAKIREAFSRAVHNRSASSIVTYWQTQIFSGNNVPPVIKATDADVLAYVRANKNAIGYVSAGTALGTGVKEVVVQ